MSDQRKTEAEQEGDLLKVQQLLGTKVAGGIPHGDKGPVQVKSLAEVVGVVNKAFPSHGDCVGPSVGQAPVRATETLEVVGNCPQCGAPVYGKQQVDRGGPAGEFPPVKYSCSCVLNSYMRTK